MGAIPPNSIASIIPRVEIHVDKYGSVTKAIMYHPKDPDKEIAFGDHIIEISTKSKASEITTVTITFDALPVYVYD